MDHTAVSFPLSDAALQQRIQALQALSLASLGPTTALELGAQVPRGLQNEQALRAIGSLSTTDEACVVDLTAAIEQLASELAILHQQLAFWRTRAERCHRLGAWLGPADDLMEAGPWQWAKILKQWLEGAVSSRPSKKTNFGQLMILPAQRVRLLWPAISALEVVLGACIRAAGTVLARCSNGERLIGSATWDDARVALQVECTKLGGPARFDSLRDRALFIALVIRARTQLTIVRPVYQRYWARLCFSGVAAVWSAQYLSENSEGMRQSIVNLYDSMRLFLTEHVIIPMREIQLEVFGGKRLRVADESALKDARDSLEVMLRSFYSRLAAAAIPLQNNLKPNDLVELAKTLDMKPASERFAAESHNPILGIVTGDLLEVILIQVAFIKKELLSALSAMDAVLAENRVNFAVAASLPAVMIIYAVGALGKFIWNSATTPLDTSGSRQAIMNSVRDLKRILDPISQSQGTSNLPFFGLRNQDIGQLSIACRKLVSAISDHRNSTYNFDVRSPIEDICDAIDQSSSIVGRQRAVDRLAMFGYFDHNVKQ